MSDSYVIININIIIQSHLLVRFRFRILKRSRIITRAATPLIKRMTSENTTSVTVSLDVVSPGIHVVI